MSSRMTRRAPSRAASAATSSKYFQNNGDETPSPLYFPDDAVVVYSVIAAGSIGKGSSHRSDGSSQISSRTRTRTTTTTPAAATATTPTRKRRKISEQLNYEPNNSGSKNIGQENVPGVRHSRAIDPDADADAGSGSDLTSVPEDEHVNPDAPSVLTPKPKQNRDEDSLQRDEQEEPQFLQVTNPSFVEKYKMHNLESGDCYFVPQFIPPSEASEWYQSLTSLSSWYRPLLRVYGKSILQSRAIAAYSTEPGLKLKYSHTEIEVEWPFPEVLEQMRVRVEEGLNQRDGEGVRGGEQGPVRFNHCMLNWYEDGNVYIGKHSDNLENKVIASLSLGAERTFILTPREPSKRGGKRKMGTATATATDTTDVNEDDNREQDGGRGETRAGRERVKMSLPNGSLFVMQGRTQEYWKHEIPKEPKIKEGRISLTFRQLVYDEKETKVKDTKEQRKPKGRIRDGI